MSLAATVKSKTQADLINEGSSFTAEGSGTVTNSVIVPITTGDQRGAVVTSYVLTTDQTTPVLVTLAFRKDTDTPIVFFRGYVVAGGPVVVVLTPETWERGAVDQDVVITTGDNVAWTVKARITGIPVELGFIQWEGAQDPDGHGNARFPDESGLARGQSEV